MKLFRQQFFSFTQVINNSNSFKNYISTPFTYIDNETFIDIHHNNIFAVLVTDPLNVFGVNVYYNKYESLYETLQDAITGSNSVSIEENNTDDVTVQFPFKTYVPYIAICSNNPDQIFIAPEKINYFVEYCNTCTVILGDYTIVFKLQNGPYYDSQYQFGPIFNLEYWFYSTTQPVSNGMNQIDPLDVEYSENNIIFTFTSIDWNGTVTINLDDFNLSGTITGIGSFNYDQDLTNVTTATFTFSNPIKPPAQIRVYLPDAVFSGNGNIELGTIDEILTLDEELQCYISDELNIYNIPAKILLPLTLNTIASNKQLIESGTILKINNYITPINNNALGERSNYCNIDYNNYNGSFTVPYNQVDDVRMYSIYQAKEIDGYIAQRNIFLIDTNAHLIDTTEQQKINVHYAYFKNPAKEYFTLSSGSETYPNYVINPENGLYKPWHPNINTFKHANFIIQADGGFISSIRIGAAPAVPTITIDTNNIQQNAATLIIAGTGFNLEPLDNIVTFNLGAVGIVTAATTTQLTVSFTTQPTSLGSLTASVLSPLNSGAAVQVATVVTSITVTENLDSKAINASTITIDGTGFNTTAANNTVAFNLGAVGAVTSATSTQLVVTFSTQPTSTGNLTAIVTNTASGNSGNAVQVATIVPAPVLYASNTYYAQGQDLIIYGTDFDAVYPANNLVTFNLGAVGTVTSATTSQLTINFATLPNAENNLTAFVNSFGGDSNTEIVAVVLINDLLTYTQAEIAPPNYFIKTISGEGTFANPLSISTSRANINDDPAPYNDLRELVFKISAAFPANAILNWNGTWTHNSNYTQIYTMDDRFYNPVPPPLYLPTFLAILEEVSACGFGNAFQNAGSTTINKIYSVGPPDPYIAEIEVLSRKDMQTLNNPYNAPELVISLWITYE